MDEIRLLGLVGKGSYGSVYAGLWRGSRVAIKKLSVPPPRQHRSRFEAETDRKTVNTFYREIDVLARLHHPNVLLFMGAA